MIKELDMNKYFVLKVDDIKKLSSDAQDSLLGIAHQIEKDRRANGKTNRNSYVVLNLDDPIDLPFLTNRFAQIVDWVRRDKGKVKDIAVDLVNAILIAREQKEAGK